MLAADPRQADPGDYSPITGSPLIKSCPVGGRCVVHFTEQFQILPGAIPLEEVMGSMPA